MKVRLLISTINHSLGQSGIVTTSRIRDGYSGTRAFRFDYPGTIPTELHNNLVCRLEDSTEIPVTHIANNVTFECSITSNQHTTVTLYYLQTPNNPIKMSTNSIPVGFFGM